MTKAPKSLQKLPVSEEPKNLTEFLERLYEQHPKLPKDATPAQEQQRLDAIINALLESPFQTEEQKQDLRNQTWEDNHNKVIQAISQKMRENGRMPATNELLKRTGLSRQTITKHLRSFQQSASYQEHLLKFRLMSDSILAQLFGLAMQGDVKAAKVYLDAVGGLTGLGSNAVPKPATNYIQINNNIKIDQLTFGLLPETVQQQITRLVLEGLQTTSGLPAQPA